MDAFRFCCGIILLHLCYYGVQSDVETELLHKLFPPDFKKEARPIKNQSQPLIVEIELEIMEFHGLDDQNGILTFMGYFESMWVAENFQWNLTEFPVPYIGVYAADIWTPDFGLSNSASNFYQRTFRDDYRVTVHNTGDMRWFAGTTLQTTCSLDVSLFPFDEQICDIKIENAVYGVDTVDIEMSDEPIELESHDINGIWEIYSHNATKITYENDGLIWPRITFSLHMRRKPFYYILNIIVPCIILACSSLGMYWLPIESGERISFGITLMLAYSVNLLVLESFIPVSSSNLPILGILVTALMAVAAFSVLASIICLHISYNKSGRMSPMARKFVFGFMAKIMCMWYIVPKRDETDLKVLITEEDSESHPNAVVEEIRDNNSLDLSSKLSEAKQDIVEIRNNLRRMMKRYDDQDQDDHYAAEWKASTRIFDAFFFWISFIFTISWFIYFAWTALYA